jgi:hypothetical protein
MEQKTGLTQRFLRARPICNPGSEDAGDAFEAMHRIRGIEALRQPVAPKRFTAESWFSIRLESFNLNPEAEWPK